MKRACAIVGVMLLSGAFSCWAQGVSQGAATVKGSATASDGTKTSFGNADLLSNTNNVLVALVDTVGGEESITLEERTTGGAFVSEVASLNKISVIAKTTAKVSAEWSLTFANADEGEVVFSGTVKVDGATFFATSASGKATGPSDRGILSITISAKTLTPLP